MVVVQKRNSSEMEEAEGEEKVASKGVCLILTSISCSKLERKFEKETYDNESGEADSSTKFRSAPEVRVFSRRWLQLLLFVFCSTMNNFQWHQYTIITNVVRRYYGVSSLGVEWTSMIFLVTYLALIFPVSYLMDRVGLRWTVLIGAAGTSLGAWMKVFSSSPDSFALTFFGQTIVAVAQTFILPIPGRLAAYWFGPREIASATALACFGIHFGFSACFLVTPIVIIDHPRVDDISDDFSKFFFSVAISCTVLTAVIYLLFQDEPPFPPSEARALQKNHRRGNAPEGFLPPVKRILSNKNFIILWNAYGLMLSALCAVTTLLNPFYLARFKGGEKEAGRLGLLIITVGSMASVIFASILDRTKKFRTVPISISVMALVGEILFAVSLIMEVKWQVFLAGMALGASLVGFASIGFELCAEATYPEPDGITTGILNIAPQIYGMILVLISGRLIEYYGDEAGLACIFVAIFFSTLLTIFNRGELRRQKAERISDYNVVPLKIFDRQI